MAIFTLKERLRNFSFSVPPVHLRACLLFYGVSLFTVENPAGPVTGDFYSERNNAKFLISGPSCSLRACLLFYGVSLFTVENPALRIRDPERLS